jgi:hypothetical protein
LRRFTLGEVLDRVRQAVLSRSEGFAFVHRWVLPDAHRCFTAQPPPAGAFARLCELLPPRAAANAAVAPGFPQPRHAELLRRVADGAREGHFNLLGMRRLPFGRPIDWHLEPTSGKKVPLVPWKRLDSLDTSVTGDKKVIWELNRHQHLVAFGRAYLHTGDARYAEALVEHMVAWIDANPPALGINWVSSVDIAFRCISWLWAIALLRSGIESPPLPAAGIARALQLQGCHIETYLSTYFSPNTHLTGEALGLYYLGTCLPELERAARWRNLGRAILLRQLEIQVRPDGAYFEQSTWYQRYTADFYMHFILLAERAGEPLPPRVRERLAALLDLLMWITRPDGTSPYIGDDDGGKLLMLEESAPNDWRATLCSGAVMFGRGDYKHVAGGFAEETHWLLGPDAKTAYERIVAEPPGAHSRAFVDGGYHVMRSGWSADSSFLLVDCGPHGALSCGHAHADALSVEVAALGTTMLVDSGTFTYTGSREMRDLFRSTAMHNTLTIDDLPSSVPAGPFKWRHAAHCTLHCWHDHARFTYFEGSHDGYARLPDPATHTRSLWFVNREYWVMLDRVDVAGDHAHATHFHLAPGLDATLHHATGRLEARGPSALLDIVYPEGDGLWSVADGFVSPCYGARVTASHATYTLRGAGQAVLLSVMFPRAAGVPPAEIRKSSSAHGRGLVVATPRFHDVVLWSADAVAAEGVEARDFAWVWMRRSARDCPLERAVLLHGSRISSDELDVTTVRPVEFVVLCVEGATLSIDVSPAAGIHIRPPPGIDRVVVNGRMHSACRGASLKVMESHVPALDLPRDSTRRCRHVRH